MQKTAAPLLASTSFAALVTAIELDEAAETAPITRQKRASDAPVMQV